MAPKSASLPTRERILDYLEEHRTATDQMLSRAWQLTPADIRYHLAALINEGLVERVPRDTAQPVKRGRPAQYYRLCSRAVPSNFPALCAALLRALVSGGSIEENDRSLRVVAEQLAMEERSRQPSPTLPVQQMNRSVEFLTQHGYRARWEAGPSGPRVLLRGCPYTAILASHPELCRMDRFLLETLAGRPFLQTARMNPQTGAPPACVFTASQSSEPQTD